MREREREREREIPFYCCSRGQRAKYFKKTSFSSPLQKHQRALSIYPRKAKLGLRKSMGMIEK
jgi:hypothetical protein